MKYSTFLPATLFSLVFFSCGKDEQKSFPKETTTGANTFGFYIGKYEFLPCKQLGGISPAKRLKATIHYLDSDYVDLSISAINDCDTRDTLGSSIILSFDSIKIATGTTYKLGTFNTKNTVSCYYWENLNEFSSDSTLAGNMTVTYFDNTRKIVSGKFEATLKNREGTRAVNVTKGIFDVTF